MRAFCLLLLAACGGAGARDPCASLVDLQWGTEQDDEALTLIPANAVAVDAEGAVYLAGTNHAGAQPGIWVRKLGAQGAQIWGARLTSSGFDFPAALAFANDGSLLLAGTRDLGGSQPVVFSLDPASGAPRWTASVPRDLNGTGIADMALDAAGNITWRAARSPRSRPPLRIAASSDPYALRFDASGKLTGSWQGGSQVFDEANAIALDSCGRILIAGAVTSAPPIRSA